MQTRTSSPPEALPRTGSPPFDSTVYAVRYVIDLTVANMIGSPLRPVTIGQRISGSAGLTGWACSSVSFQAAFCETASEALLIGTFELTMLIAKLLRMKNRRKLPPKPTL